ncbi:MAG: GAF domain-containing protein [Dehalococcoidia bacterium]
MTISRITSKLIDPYDDGSNASMNLRMRDVLTDIGRVMSSSLYIEEIYSHFVQQAKRIMEFDRITVMTVDRTNWTARYAYISGIEVPGCTVGCEVSISGTFREQILASKTGCIITEQYLREAAQEFPSGLTAITLQQGIREILSVPLLWNDEVIGLLTVCSLAEGTYDQDDLRTLKRIGETIAGPVANSQIHAELQRYANESSTLAEIGHIVNSSIQFDEAFAQLANRASLLIPFDQILVSLRNHESGEITYTNVLGTDILGWTTGNTGPLGPVERAALLRRSAVIRSAGVTYVNDGPEPYSDAGTCAGLAGVLVAPIVLRDEVLGFLSFRSKRSDRYTPSHKASATRIAGLIAGPVANARLHAELQLEIRPRSLIEQITGAALGTDSFERFSCLCVEILNSFVPIDGLIAASVSGEEELWELRGAQRELTALRAFSHFHAALVPPATNITGNSVDQIIGCSTEVPEWVRQFMGKPKSWMQASVKLDATLFGLVAVTSDKEDCFSEEQLGLLQSVARSILLAYQKFAPAAPVLTNRQKDPAHLADLAERLTDRDREILQGVVQGATNSQIARQLHLAEGTVRNRLTDIYRRLGIAHRSEAAYLATRLGVV